MYKNSRVQRRARTFAVTAGLALALTPAGFAFAEPAQDVNAPQVNSPTTVNPQETQSGATNAQESSTPLAETPQTPQSTTPTETPSTPSEEPSTPTPGYEPSNASSDDGESKNDTGVATTQTQTPTSSPVNDTDGVADNNNESVKGNTASNTTVIDTASLADTSKSDAPKTESTSEANASTASAPSNEDIEAQAREASLKNVSINAHVQDIGWTGAKNNEAGTTGQGLRMEAVRITLYDEDGNQVKGVSYKSHVQNIGWTHWVTDGELSGTTGQALRVEAIKLALSEELAKYYDIVYRVHVQDYGWLDWTSNGAAAGTTGQSLRIEAIGAYLQRKNAAKIGNGKAAFIGTDKGDAAGVYLTSHVQNIGWISENNGVAGTTGKGLRLEAFTAALDGVSGGITYNAHVQNIGWMAQVSNGATAGTTGKGLAIEASGFNLTGEAAQRYDIYYRAHVQDLGWLGWAKNGESLGAGTQGLSKRMEALEVKLVPKGGAAPSSSGSLVSASFVAPMNVTYASASGNSWLSQVSNGDMSGNTNGSLLERMKAFTSPTIDSKGQPTGSISYQLLSTNGTWSASKSNGAETGTLGTDTRGLKMTLGGDLGKVFDVYYRAHVEDRGWLGWAKNGAEAGTKVDAGIDAIGVMLVAKGNAAPSNSEATYTTPLLTGDWRQNTIEKYLNTAVAIANDPSHGYSQGSTRWGPDYDCSSLVITCLRAAGLNTGEATYTGNMLEELTKHGWDTVPYTSMGALQRGDILLNIRSHTEFYLGGGKNVAALISENGTIFGTPGDQTGNEIKVKNFTVYGNGSWDVVLRLRY